MDRRDVLATLLAAPLLTVANSAAYSRRKRIGFVAGTTPQKALAANPLAFNGSRTLVEVLEQRGWRVGTDVEILWRSAEGRLETLGPIYDELIALPVDVLVIFADLDGATARTRTIPIVLNGYGASTHLKSENSKNFPSNVTGTLWSYPESGAKTLEVLKAAVPGARRVAVAVNERIEGVSLPDGMVDAARWLGISLIHAPYSLDRPDEGLDRARAAGAQALLVRATTGTSFPDRLKTLVAWLRRHRMPSIHGNLQAAESGGLLAYGPDQMEIYRRTAHFVDRALRGTRPADMPLEQPALKLVANVEAARAIGITIPKAVLLQADKVIG